MDDLAVTDPEVSAVLAAANIADHEEKEDEESSTPTNTDACLSSIPWYGSVDCIDFYYFTTYFYGPVCTPRR